MFNYHAMSIKVTASTLVERDGGFLLVQEGTDPKKRFNLPGGGEKKRETIMDAAVRETLEETGLEVRLRSLIGIYQVPRTEARNNLTRFVFEAVAVSGSLQTSDHHPEVDFFSYKTIKKMHEAGQISSLSVLMAISDYRNGHGAGLSILKELPKVKRNRLLPKGHIELNPEYLDA